MMNEQREPTIPTLEGALSIWQVRFTNKKWINPGISVIVIIIVKVIKKREK